MRRGCSALGAVVALLSAACWPAAFALDSANVGAFEPTRVGGLDASDSPQVTYPLDGVSRWIDEGKALACETGALELTSYAGEHVRFARAVRIHPAFRSQLVAFEALVVELAEAHFGRAPRRLVHLGAYVCRAMRGRAHLISEHALGNALDLAGFEFGPLPRKKIAPATLPRALRGAFAVSIKSDWEASGRRAAQAAFLRDLVARLLERPDIVRSLVGPGWPGHDNHFHLAMPPYRLVKIGQTVRWGY
jgi:hypothetical protein